MAIWKVSRNPHFLGLSITMVINHWLSGMILQVGGIIITKHFEKGT